MAQIVNLQDLYSITDHNILTFVCVITGNVEKKTTTKKKNGEEHTSEDYKLKAGLLNLKDVKDIFKYLKYRIIKYDWCTLWLMYTYIAVGISKVTHTSIKYERERVLNQC